MSTEAIERAKRLGTYGKIDRSKQYEDQRYSSETLLRNDDLLFAKVRRLENLRFRHRVALMAGAAVFARAPEIWAWFSRLF